MLPAWDPKWSQRGVSHVLRAFAALLTVVGVATGGKPPEHFRLLDCVLHVKASQHAAPTYIHILLLYFATSGCELLHIISYADTSGMLGFAYTRVLQWLYSGVNLGCQLTRFGSQP